MSFEVETGKPESEEIDPFIKRVVTVKSGDVVLFKYDGHFTTDFAEEIRAQIAERLGAIPFLVVDRDFDITVLKQPEKKSDFVGLA